MELTVRQSCPSCGADITLGEDDRLLACEYCGVNNYMVHQDLPRYVLPAKLPAHIDGREVYHVPYLRFKGTIFYCLGGELQYRLIDTTRIGVNVDSLPVSLGLRPQAMNITRVTANLPGRYVFQSAPARQIFADAARLTMLFEREAKDGPRHRAFIGETVSRVYLPVYGHLGVLFDGVTNEPLGSARLLDDLQKKTVAFKPAWEPSFLSTLCPECGASMHGARDSLVMTCTNCDTVWEENKGKFVRLDFGLIPQQDRNVEYLPFWVLEPETEGYELHSLADYIELTNQPIVVQREHREKRLAIVVPAFKVKPRAAMVVAKNLTLLQLVFNEEVAVPAKRSYPVTMPFPEAVQSLKSVLVGTATSQRKVIDLLDELRFTVRRKKLLYLPFRQGRDLIQEQTGVSLSSVALAHGRLL